MQPWIVIDTARVPGGAEDLRLLQRGTEFVINLGTELLMGSRQRGSEQALATLGCAGLMEHRNAGRVLIGGLGMGFTLRAALDMAGPDTAIDVAEIVPAVVKWVQGPLAHLSGNALADRRVTIVQADVGRHMQQADRKYDAILLDVDNGPEALTRTGNGELYRPSGLRSAWMALSGGGVLAVWSAFPDNNFSRKLAGVGFSVEEHPVRAHGGKGARHVIWVARKPSSAGHKASG